MKKRGLFIFIIFIISSQLLFAFDYSFKRITTKEGLSNSWVRCIYQDNQGFIWIGTADGLNRYDGKNFRVFRPKSDRNFSLGNISINDIIEQNKDNLWLATDAGLFNFDIRTEEMRLDTVIIPTPILCIDKCQQGNYWFGTNLGLAKYNPVESKTTYFKHQPNNDNSLSNDYINTLTFDSNQNLWIGTKQGLTLFNTNTNTFKRIQNTSILLSQTSNDVSSIFEDHKKTIWVGTSQDGLYYLKKSKEEFHFEKVLDGTISSLISVQNNMLWIGHGSDEGISILDLEKLSANKFEIDELQFDPIFNKSISSNSIFCFYKDNLNDLWIGTLGSGINYYSPRSNPFQNVTVRFDQNSSIKNSVVNAIYEEDDFLWIGTQVGLDRLSKKTGEFVHYQYEHNNPASLASNSILCIYKDSKKNLWIGTWAGGLNKYNYKTNSFKRYLPSKKVGSISSPHVFSIAEDKFGNLWVGTNSGGLNRFDYQTETFKIYQHTDSDPYSISSESMNHLFISSKGDLYISLYNIIEKYNYESDNFIHISRRASESYQFGFINSIFEDSNHNFWLASNAGLELYDENFNLLQIYTIENGLPDNTIQTILEDDNNNLWMSTNNGLSKFHKVANIPQTPIFQNFTADDGLPANDFKSRASFKFRDGYFYFGSSNGYTKFHPDSIKTNTVVPEMVLTNFLIQQSVPNEYSKFRTLEQNLNTTEKIDLHYPNTDFIISYAALNYLNSEKNIYKYKLDGYDTEWIDAGSSTTASYTNIPGGSYYFMVMGTNNDGIWCESPKSIKIVIHPPWWNTLFFKLMVVISIIVSSVLFLVFRFTSMNKENKELEDKVEKRTNELSKFNVLLEDKQIKITEQNKELELHRNQLEQLVNERTKQLIAARSKAEESDRLKSAFLANMSHEIRTPMNAIIGFSNMLANENLTNEKRLKYIEHISSNGKSLNYLIKDIIDISIIEAQQLVLSPSDFSINKVLSDLELQFEMETNPEIELIYLNKNSASETIIYNDAIRFKQVMVNLLSNAFKYSDRGKIKYGFEVFKTEVQFFVSDNGIGIHEKEKVKVFNHFYKSDKDKTKLYRGTGIGLAICKSLVNAMGGKIWLESQLNVGSTFYFTLPVLKNENLN